MQFINHPLLKKDKIQARLYQELLTARIVENGNTLVVAPTALGKTVIAAMVTAHKLQQEPDKKVIILAPTKPLVAQHFNSFKEFLTIEDMGMLTGETKAEDRSEIYENCKVIFGTPQTMQNDLFASRAKLDDVSLLVIDEAHRAVGDYAYTFIADQYMRKCSNPHLLALTASPGGTREKIQEICRNLFIENVEVKNETDTDVKPYIQEKEMTWIEVNLPEEFLTLKGLMEGIMQETLRLLKELGYARSTSLREYNKIVLLRMQQSLFKEKSHTKYQAISYVAALMKMYHAYDLLQTQGIQQLDEYLAKLKKDGSKASKRLMTYVKMQKLMVQVTSMASRGVEHPKMAKLLEVLESNSGQVIVFSHYRATAKRIAEYLNEAGIPAKTFVGQSTKEGSKGLRQKEQLERIQEFRDKEFRVLVATSVGEEGLDIPSVELVVFYEPVSSEIRKIQRAGRTGRHEKGKVVILIAKGTKDEAYYWASRKKEKNMKKVLKEMNDPKTLFTKPEKQSTLSEYSKSDSILIYVDQRERASGVMKALMELDCTIKPMQLPVGDYLLSERVAVERKSTSDFVSSMINGRLFQQAAQLKEQFKNPIILIEGNDLFEIRNVHPNAIRGALAALAIDWSIPILWTKDIDETAAMLYSIAKREQQEKAKPIRLQGEKRTMGDKEQQEFIVESLPGVGNSLAKELLKYFGDIEKVFIATEKQLKLVEKIGDKKAKSIRKILTRKYED